MVTVAREAPTAAPADFGPEGKPWVRLPTRILLTSTIFPPATYGHAIALDRIFRGVHPDDYRIVHFDELSGFGEVVPEEKPPLPGKTIRIPSSWLHVSPADFGALSSYPLKEARRLRHFAIEVSRTARRLAEVCRDEGCGAIVVTTGTLPRLPAATLAARLAKVPLVILVWDFWRYMEVIDTHRRIAEILEPVVFKAATRIVVPNELLADSIARIDGVRPSIVRLPVDDVALRRDVTAAPVRRDDDDFRVVFTGVVYLSMTDPYLRLLRALEEPGLEDASFHFYGRQTREALEPYGFRGKIKYHGFLAPPEIYDAQRRAGALFLPLGFESTEIGDHNNLVYSSSTTKLADYLASGRPVIVHTPPGAFPAWYVRRHECGLVVDTPDSKVLAQAVRTLMDNPELAARLGRNGAARARADFSIDAARGQLLQVLTEAVVAGGAKD